MPLRYIKEHTLVRNLFFVISAPRLFLKVVQWRFTKELIVARNLFLAISVQKHFLRLVFWQYMEEHILVRNLLFVISVSSHLLEVTDWRITKEFIVDKMLKIFIFLFLGCNIFIMEVPLRLLLQQGANVNDRCPLIGAKVYGALARDPRVIQY